MLLEYYMIREGIPPIRSNPSDAGLDIFFNPPEGDNRQMGLAPGSNEKISTGLKFGIPHGYMLQVMNRSSMASKKSLVVGAHCIDSGYAGEVFIDLHNIGTEPQWITAGDKIAQLVMIPVVHFRAVKTQCEDLYGRTTPITISDRGGGGVGSTGV
jgi:dUTP pyrophosphatase